MFLPFPATKLTKSAARSESWIRLNPWQDNHFQSIGPHGTPEAGPGGENHLISMKTQNITALVLATGFLTTAAFADNSPATSAPAPTAITSQPPAPNQIIYLPQLPSVGELTGVAAAQGLTIKQITQSARELSVTYQFADGQTKIVSYQVLLPNVGVNPAQLAPPTVVYAEPPPPVYYYDPYYPAYWYPPVSFRFGFGFGRGHRR